MIIFHLPINFKSNNKFTIVLFFTVDTQNKRANSREVAVRSTVPKPKRCDKVNIGEIVMCKMRGFNEWPAIVTGFENNLIVVEFFGDHKTHKSSIKNVFKFKDCSEIILSNLKTKKSPLFAKSVQETEVWLGISDEHSIFKRINIVDEWFLCVYNILMYNCLN